MHEAAMVRELIALARERTPCGGRVLEVHVAVGLLTGVSPDAMRFYFEALAPEELGPQATLLTRLVPLRAACPSCGWSAVLDEAAWACPACGAPSLAFQNGDELDLTSLVVAHDEPDHDRTEDPQEERRDRPREPQAAR